MTEIDRGINPGEIKDPGSVRPGGPIPASFLKDLGLIDLDELGKLGSDTMQAAKDLAQVVFSDIRVDASALSGFSIHCFIPGGESGPDETLDVHLWTRKHPHILPEEELEIVVDGMPSLFAEKTKGFCSITEAKWVQETEENKNDGPGGYFRDRLGSLKSKPDGVRILGVSHGMFKKIIRTDRSEEERAFWSGVFKERRRIRREELFGGLADRLRDTFGKS